MNLGFRTHFPFDKSKETKFKEKISRGTKIHTIREDKLNRWVVGRVIHFCTGVRTKAYDCFKMGKVVSVQKVEISIVREDKTCLLNVRIDDKSLKDYQIAQLIQNDGFDNANDFIDWFANKEKVNYFSGKIIHWTDFKYVI